MKKWFTKKKAIVVVVALIILIAIGSNNDKKEGAIEKGNVKVEITETDIELYDGMLVVAGKVDLPDGEELVISLSKDDYQAADTQEVVDRIFLTEPFSLGGEPLPSGEYTVSVTTREGDLIDHKEKVVIE